MVHLSNEDVYLFEFVDPDNEPNDIENPANEMMPNDPRKLFFCTAEDINNVDAPEANAHDEPPLTPPEEEEPAAPVVLDDELWLERIIHTEDSVTTLHVGLNAVADGLGELLQDMDAADANRELLEARLYKLELVVNELKSPRVADDTLPPIVIALVGVLSVLIVFVLVIMGVTVLL